MINIKPKTNLRPMQYLLITIGLILSVQVVSAPSKKNAKSQFGIPKMGIAVDLNRDGKVEFAYVQAPLTEIVTNLATEPTDLTYVEIDKTTDNIKVLPYRFWINNDLDVVNNNGIIQWDSTSCTGLNDAYDPEPDVVYQQICEQWDETPTLTNTTNTLDKTKLNKIESYRDLEDFAPLKIVINVDNDNDSEEYEWVLKAVGVSVNLFKGIWRDDGINKAHAYIYDTQTTRLQVEAANANDNILLSNSVSHKITKNEIAKFFTSEFTGNPDGLGHFIFEGISGSPGCKAQPQSCYLAIIYKRVDSEKPLREERVYLDLHDVEDFYEHLIAGPSADNGATYVTQNEFGEDIALQSAYHANYDGSGVSTRPGGETVLNIYDGLYPSTEITKDYVLQIHGWRMQDSEKKSFSDTSFKRLYWSGYKGRMGALHWPTGWFEKPAYVYSSIGLLSYVLGNERNYDVSEVVARRVGVDLAAWLSANQTRNPGTGMHIVAHSMGNVVASEALLNGGAAFVTSYAASMAAIDAGSYDSNAADIQHTAQIYPESLFWVIPVPCGGLAESPEYAWRCYNADSNPDTPFDMPPDMYRYDWVVYDDVGNPVTDANNNYIIQHGQTSSSVMGPNPVTNGQPITHYFAGIGDNVNIVNLFNSEDGALTAWEFNQLTKPDVAQGENWTYTNDYLEVLKAYNACNPDSNTCTEPALPETVTSIFKRGGVIVPYNEQTKFDIIAYAIPARTEPLGQEDEVNGEISPGSGELNGLTDSNQDHSAPFHGYYSEISVRADATSPQQRAAYWNLVLSQSIILPSSNYTGLKNTIQ